MSFSNPPEGGHGRSSAEGTSTERAEHCPIRPSSCSINSTDDPKIKEELDEGKSRNFVIRTTEKEPELVQACLDQLFRENGKELLLQKVYARDRQARRIGESRLSLLQDEPRKAKKPESPNATASPSFVKSPAQPRIARELRHHRRKVVAAASCSRSNGEGNSDSDGKYQGHEGRLLGSETQGG